MTYQLLSSFIAFQPSSAVFFQVFKNLVSNCSTYFGYSEELAVAWTRKRPGQGQPLADIDVQPKIKKYLKPKC